jgi:hypothetical protein
MSVCPILDLFHKNLELSAVFVLSVCTVTTENPTVGNENILLDCFWSWGARERGWWITCNYPTVLKEKNINMNSSDYFIIYFWLHKVIKVFLFIIFLNVILFEAISRMKSRLHLACFTLINVFYPSSFSRFVCCCKPCNPLLILFHFAL